MELWKPIKHLEMCNYYHVQNKPCDCGADPWGTGYWALLDNGVLQAVKKAVAEALPENTRDRTVQEIMQAANNLIAVAIDTDY